MKAYMEAAGVWIRHNVAFVTSIVMCLAMVCWTYGCDSKVTSIVKPGENVTRAQLAVEVKQQGGTITRSLAQKIGAYQVQVSQLRRDIEAAKEAAAADVNALAALSDLKYADLDRQDAIKIKALEIGQVVAAGGTVDPVGAVLSFMGILGIGAVIDNRRKDGIIAGQKMNRAA